jgi:hypothetical protein
MTDTTRIIWEQGSSDSANPENFATISQWWASMDGQEVSWRQRLISSEISWEPARFDEKFILRQPQIRGITVYWRRDDVKEEKGSTAAKLELDTLQQQLYIYPQSQRELVIRVGIPELIYQKFSLTDPQLEVAGNVLVFRDTEQLVEVSITMSEALWQQLQQSLP